jgi:hypothetical protein
MFLYGFTYGKEKLADVLRHVEEEHRKMDPAMTLPAPKHSHMVQTAVATLVHLMGALLG